MAKREVFVSRSDRQRLLELIAMNRELNARPNVYLEQLEAELKSAHEVEPHEIPADVVTLNSTIRIFDLDTEEEKTFTLVLPAKVTDAKSTVSILSPLGTALIGYRQGDVVEWATHKGKLKFSIEEVLYQPEREGVYTV
ncbi:MAG: nucleoside diphosphate kinase regulator [Acidobacteriota bacterium]|nr:nucleoside diphosphate kinase regulator [Acidobacteriota bacterium]